MLGFWRVEKPPLGHRPVNPFLGQAAIIRVEFKAHPGVAELMRGHKARAGARVGVEDFVAGLGEMAKAKGVKGNGFLCGMESFFI